MKVFIELIIKLSIISCCLLFKTTFAAFGIKYTGTLAAIIDPNGVYYYEYDSYIAKCQLSDGTVVAKQQLTSPLRFSTVAISPDGAYLLFAVGPVTTSDSFNSGIGIFKTDTSTFGESSSLKINYYDGSTEQNPRYEKIIIFNSKLENLKTTSYDIMIGGRANYANDNDKDIFLIYSGLFHGSNKTIEILKYYLFNQGSPTISQTLEATLPDYRETGFLAFVELDSPNQASVVCLTKFMEPVSTAQGYQVNLMSMKRDLSQLNWMLRFNNNYQAEVKLKTNLYLMITRGSDLYIEIINPSNGSVLQSIHYTIGNNEYLYYPQMAISNRFNTLFLLSSVRNITASPTPLQNQLMRVTLFSTADLSIMSDSFTFSQVSTPYTIDILQLSSSEQVIIKGTLDSVVNTNEQRFTLSLYPLVHTQSISTCSLSSYLNAIGVSGSLSSVTEASLSGLLTDISSNIRLYSSGITYVASPPALTTVSLCSVSTITPLEIVGTQSTYHTQNFTCVTVPKSSSIPTGLTINYEVLQPSSYQVNITSDSSNVYFNFTHEYNLNSSFILQFNARVNSTLYTTDYYNVSVSCRTECTYCENSDECIECATGYESFCEEMFLSDKRLIVAVAGVLKFFVLIIAFRSFMKLRIDHAFWILINMFQVLRIITLMNVKVGLVLRDFLNDQLKEFMIQLNINLLPKLLFSETTTESRYYTLFGIESYLCIYFIITTIIVIFATAFLLTMMLAVLECMKKTKRRLKLMIAIATYLSLNLWIRGIFEFTLTLFIVCTLDIQRAFTQSIGIVSGTSKAFALLFLIFIVTMSIIAVRYFVKHREHEKWPKGIIELYESVKPTKTSIFAYNFIFLAKRMLLAFNVTLIGKYGDTLQLSLNVVIIFAFMILCVGFVRFKCKLTMVIYLIAEFICLGSFSLMFLYQNEQQAGKMFNISITDDTVDKIIIIFVSAGMLVVMGIVFAECIAGCIRIRKQGRLSNKTKAKPPKSSRNRHLVEEDKDRSSNLDILKPQEHHEIMDVKELDQLGAVKEDESYLSKHTINAIGVNNPTQSNLNYEDIMITKHKGDIEGVEMPKSSQFNKKRMIITQDPSNL